MSETYVDWFLSNPDSEQIFRYSTVSSARFSCSNTVLLFYTLPSLCVCPSEWLQSDLVRGSRLSFSQRWSLILDQDHNIQSVLPPGPCLPLNAE